ncbi:MAG: glycogen debranching enzyme, partial [Nitrospiraceae bacterium]|nr:glycogen debranching enzyme [Nitrospiraceae bacterium]
MARIDVSSLRPRPGRAYPLGANVRYDGIRFAVVSRHATRVWLALFENIADHQPAIEFEFNSDRYRIGDIWSMYVEGLSAGTPYMYRMDGPFDPETGHRYDATQYLLDPYAKLIVGDVQDRTAKCLAVGEKLDWADDVGPKYPVSEMIIYETHVRGFTVHSSSEVEHGGTYLGLLEKIPYLKDLGVTAVELLPIQEFGENRIGRCSLVTGEELLNYWGYSSIGFFAPTGRYATQGGNGEQINEFRQMVAALHEAGIEVILDVVFNHTSEGDHRGPTLCFRGIDNTIYYMLDDDGAYRNFSGCGNTLNCNHPLVRDFILDCLRFWATVMHVDGFRFDLASILGRDTDGNIVENAVLVERIAEDPALRDTKLIAEAWDAGGAYQVGSFGDFRWAEWNGRYRDDVRRFWRGDAGMRSAFATRLTGSADLYQWAGRTPGHSINFITAHDGFTLHDLVS